MARGNNLQPRDRILSELAVRGGSMPHRVMARRFKMEQADLDLVLEELEKENMIKRMDLKVGKTMRLQIRLKVPHRQQA